MTRKEAMRRTHLNDTLRALGFTDAEAESLRRISMTLHRWHELECGIDNGCVERNEATNEAFWHNSHTGQYTKIADRETGARKRLAKILTERNERCESGSGTRFTANFLSAYVQTDPRGAALYILRPGDVPEGEDAGAYYSRGICVY